MFTLYATPLSANARKPLAVARQLGLSPELRIVNVYAGEGLAPEFRRLSPLGKVPALVDGPLQLTESNAIVQYIAEAYGDGRLLRSEPPARAQMARWMFWEASHWQPELARVLAPTVAHGLGLAPAPGAPPGWDDAALAPHLALLDEHLRGRPWLVDDAPSLADFAVGGMTTYFRYCGFPAAAHPDIAAWQERLEGLEGWRATETAPWSAA